MSHDEMFFQILTNLIEEWLNDETVNQIGSDEDKIERMIVYKDYIISNNLVVPKHISEFYFRVFLRDEFTGTR